jgi:hypothetical protein
MKEQIQELFRKLEIFQDDLKFLKETIESKMEKTVEEKLNDDFHRIMEEQPSFILKLSKKKGESVVKIKRKVSEDFSDDTTNLIFCKNGVLKTTSNKKYSYGSDTYYVRSDKKLSKKINSLINDWVFAKGKKEQEDYWKKVRKYCENKKEYLL